eukprot:763053-Hanusia_phi.AAC.11
MGRDMRTVKRRRGEGGEERGEEKEKERRRRGEGEERSRREEGEERRGEERRGSVLSCIPDVTFPWQLWINWTGPVCW